MAWPEGQRFVANIQQNPLLGALPTDVALALLEDGYVKPTTEHVSLIALELTGVSQYRTTTKSKDESKQILLRALKSGPIQYLQDHPAQSTPTPWFKSKHDHRFLHQHSAMRVQWENAPS